MALWELVAAGLLTADHSLVLTLRRKVDRCLLSVYGVLTPATSAHSILPERLRR
jgi:hypothetical protein